METIEIRFVVAPQYAGWRLDHFLKAQVPRLSRARIQRMIAAQAAGVGPSPGEATGRWRAAARVQAGQEIRLLRPAPIEPPVPRTFEVLHEDEALLAIAKPAGLPMHATALYHRNTLTALLREHFGAEATPRLVHRLDRETSGIVLLARTRSAEIALKGQLARRRMHKAYLAIVHGDPGPSGVVELPIGADTVAGIRVKRAVVAAGLASCTRFRRLARRGPFSLVEAMPETGRQHQIRVHLAAIGAPVVGDKLYGLDPRCHLEYLETGWTASLAERLLLPRQALHAASICFTHPADGEVRQLRCPLPADLVQFWRGLPFDVVADVAALQHLLIEEAL
ncbi:MAG: RluA family pseudouridine synthase [Proteobacteria bacterium]|nr:RluA family pseudouridine synthase [Pseudomonadota bacterium]